MSTVAHYYNIGGFFMLKRLSAVCLLLCLLAGLLPGGALAAEPHSAFRPEDAAAFCNSDSVAFGEDCCWYVDTMGDNRLLAERRQEAAPSCTWEEVPVTTEALTDFPVNQVLYWEGTVLCSAGNHLLWLDAGTGALLDSRSFSAPVDRFARSAEALYVLTGGVVLRLAGEREEPLALEAPVLRFWLEDAEHLSYMTNEAIIHTRALSSGVETLAPNQSSDLSECLVPRGDETQGESFVSLKEKYPHGKYWNHMPDRGTGPEYNNQDGWTEEPCPGHNSYCGTSMQTCNGYAPNDREISWQCWGYADKLGYDLTGLDPESTGSGWQKFTGSGAADSLKAGDIIRYQGNYTAHVLFITAVDGDTVTFTDCNIDGHCIIRWDQTISLSTLKSRVLFVLSAPGGEDAGDPKPTEPKPSEPETWTFNVNACLDGEHAVNTVGYAIFDLYYRGYLLKKDATDYLGTFRANSSYEIRNIRPQEGVLFDPEASSVISGCITADTELILALDHYYLNLAGEPVKTTLTDLPAQKRYSYRPICWALEEGIAAGATNREFRPRETCTRGQVVTLLWNALGQPKPKAESSPFVDVLPGKFYYLPVLWASETGVASGMDKTHFEPKSGCTRGQVVTFLWNALGQPEPSCTTHSFVDVRPGKFYYKAMLWALEAGVASGTDATHFSPDEPCTREQVVTFLYYALSGR